VRIRSPYRVIQLELFSPCYYGLLGSPNAPERIHSDLFSALCDMRGRFEFYRMCDLPGHHIMTEIRVYHRQIFKLRSEGNHRATGFVPEEAWFSVDICPVLAMGIDRSVVRQLIDDGVQDRCGHISERPAARRRCWSYHSEEVARSRHRVRGDRGVGCSRSCTDQVVLHLHRS
jgi:hypothetical protein